MANEGEWFEALTASFPGRNPRPLLSWVYGASAVVGLLVGGLYVVVAFVTNAGLGFVVLAAVVFSLLVWLGLLRVMLEAAVAMFDMRDAVARIERGSFTTDSVPERSPNAGRDASVRPSTATAATTTGTLHESRVPAAAPDLTLSPIAVARYLQDQDGATFEAIAKALGVQLRDVSEAIKELEIDHLVVRHQGGVYTYTGSRLDTAASTAEDSADKGPSSPTAVTPPAVEDDAADH